MFWRSLREAGSETLIDDSTADKGYHANQTLTDLAQHTFFRTYIPERQSPHNRVWTDKPPEQKAAVYANRRRTRGDRGKKLQRLRSERVERSFAHVCEPGGARRTWLHRIIKVRKRYQIAAAAHTFDPKSQASTNNRRCQLLVASDTTARFEPQNARTARSDSGPKHGANTCR